MKKRNLKLLNLNKNIVSNFYSEKVKGAGTTIFPCASHFGCASSPIVCSNPCHSNPIPGCFVRESEIETCDGQN